jgi:two-component system sensor histidine kinase TtrS
MNEQSQEPSPDDPAEQDAGRGGAAGEMDLVYLSRVHTMGQMVSGLAHELNQPLGAISNYVAVCMAQLVSDHTDYQTLLTALNGVLTETRRAADLLGHMRTYVRKCQPRARPVDVNHLIERSLAMLQYQFRRQRVAPDVRLAENLPLGQADPLQIDQVLVNLICNALEAMEGVSPSARSLTIQSGLDSGGLLFVSIADSGPGMTPEVLGRLFEPFFTTKPTGMGMGLNISRSIVENHGGRLSATRLEGGGTQFRFTLPAAGEELLCQTTSAA